MEIPGFSLTSLKTYLMKKYLLIALLGAAVFGSCRKNMSCDFPASSRDVRMVYQHRMKIDTFTHEQGTMYTVADSGNQDVFLYSNQWGTTDETFDNEYYSNVWFAVDSGLTSFSYKDSEMAEHRCYYIGSGAWSGYPNELLDRGTISGVKNADGTWNISIDVTLDKREPHFGGSEIIMEGAFAEGVLW